jgi:hypothetical protein
VSLGQLAIPVQPKIKRIGKAALSRIREQARLQVQGREEGRLLYEVLDQSEIASGENY